MKLLSKSTGIACEQSRKHPFSPTLLVWFAVLVIFLSLVAAVVKPRG
jgi:hypothetical protein